MALKSRYDGVNVPSGTYRPHVLPSYQVGARDGDETSGEDVVEAGRDARGQDRSGGGSTVASSAPARNSTPTCVNVTSAILYICFTIITLKEVKNKYT
jgi:hypothetical protein